MYNAAYIQHVEELTALLYDYEKDKKKLTKKIKCIVKEAYCMSRKGSDAPFVPATPAEWMSLYYQDRATCKRYIKNRDVVYYPEKLSSEFTKYINFIITILFFYYDPDFNKLSFNGANKNLSDMLKLVETNVASSGMIKKSAAFSHANIKDVFGDDVDFKVMFEKVWEKVTKDTEIIKYILVPDFTANPTSTNARLSATANFGTPTTFNFLFIKAAVNTDTNTLLLGAYEQYGGKIYSLERVYFWDDKTASKPDEYNILTFDEEITDSAAKGKFYLQDSKKGRRGLTEAEVKNLQIRNAYYFYVKEDDDVKDNSSLTINYKDFQGVTEADNATELYTKSIAMNILSKTPRGSAVLKKRVQQALNSPMGFRSLVNGLVTWVYSWKSQQ